MTRLWILPITNTAMGNLTQLFLVRHAEVEPRYQRVFGGRIDMDLSTRGHEQAGRLADYLRAVHFRSLYASPMKRVQQTLQPIVALNGYEPVTVTGFREVDFGDWTGHGWEAVRQHFNLRAHDWLHHLSAGNIQNAEPEADFRSRIEPELRRILQQHDGETVCIACHGGVIRMMLSILLDLPLPKTAAFDIEYASVTRVEIKPEGAEIRLLNLTPWRDL